MHPAIYVFAGGALVIGVIVYQDRLLASSIRTLNP